MLSSKYLDYKNWLYILEKQTNIINQKQINVNSYLDEAMKIRKDFNKTRTTYNWDHLKNCNLIK